MISFVAPIMLFLLSIFSHGIVIVQKRADEEMRQIRTLLAIHLTSRNQTIDGNVAIAKSYKDLNKNEKLNKKKLNLLNPKRQIIRTFAFLFLSLGLIMADMLIKERAWKLYNHWLSVSLLLASFISLGYSMIILWQVGWEIIDTKRIIAEEEEAEKINSEVTTNAPSGRTPRGTM